MLGSVNLVSLVSVVNVKLLGWPGNWGRCHKYCEGTSFLGGLETGGALVNLVKEQAPLLAW